MRYTYLDNLKGILISLVVVGHAIEPLIESTPWINALYTFIYIFHMPLFAYASGAVSSKIIDGAYAKKLITNLVIPYVSLELIYSTFDYLLFSKDTFIITPLTPNWILWYLVSLLSWRLLLPLANQLRLPISTSIFIGLVFGAMNQDLVLSLSRTFTFFPFFLIGYYHHSTLLKSLPAPKIRQLTGAIILILGFIIVLTRSHHWNLDIRWLYGNTSYSNLETDLLHGTIIRTFLYMLSCTLGLALLFITTQTRNILTTYGAYSMYPYILHGFILKLCLAIGLYNYIKSDISALVLVLSSLILLPILCSYPFRVILNSMLNPFRISQALIPKTKKT